MRCVVRCVGAATLVGLVAMGCTERVNEVRLVVPEDSVGLSCVDSSTGQPLVARASIDARGAELSVLVDYLAFDGVPSCRPTQILGWCRDRGCPLVQRDCVRVRIDAPLPSGVALYDAVAQELRALSPVTRDAPDGVVIVRTTLTNQPCDDVAPASGELPRLRCDGLMACVYSCPVQLDAVEGDVLLDLDTLDAQCTEEIVAICAGLGQGPDPGCVP